MAIKEIKYNSDNRHVIINDKELNIKISDYIEIVESAQKNYILNLLLILDYVLFKHIQDFVKSEFDLGISSVNHYLGELETQGMINTYKLNSTKYAMLSTKGTVLITGNPNSIAKSPPQINNLFTQAYISKIFLNNSISQVFDFGDSIRYKYFYNEYKKSISMCSGFEIYDHSGRITYEGIYNCLKADYPAYIKELKKPLTKDMISDSLILDERMVRRYLSNILKTPFSSAKEYVDDQIGFIDDYIKLTEYEKTINTRDEIGRMMHKNIYFMSYDKDTKIVKFILFDVLKPNNSIIKEMYELNKCIGKMNQFLDKTYLKFNLVIATPSSHRTSQVKSYLDNRLKEIEKENDKLVRKCSFENNQISSYALAMNKYNFEKAMPYFNKIEMWNLNIGQYFEHNRKKGDV